MNADNFAEWLRRQGKRVIRTKSSYWHEQGPRVYQAFPYHWLIGPSEDELSRLLRNHHLLGIRFSTPVNTSSVGMISYHATYHSKTYDFAALSKYSRRDARRGLRRCQVEQISFSQLASEGWLLQEDTLDRQDRRANFTRDDWHALCLGAADLSGFEAWGALIDGKLAASVITFQMEDCCYMLYQQSLRQYLGEYVNNALAYQVTHIMVSRPSIRSILYGLHSLDAPPSVDEFKFRMGYSAKPVRQRAVFHPLLSPLANRATHALLSSVATRNQEIPLLTKAEGMLRFFLEGKRPLRQQSWPQALVDDKAELIRKLEQFPQESPTIKHAHSEVTAGS